MAEQKVLRKLGIKHRKCLLRGEPHGRHLFYSILYKEKAGPMRVYARIV